MFRKHGFIAVLLVLISGCILVEDPEHRVYVDPAAYPDNWSSVFYSYTGDSFTPLSDTIYLSDVVHGRFEGGMLYDFSISIDNEVVVPFGTENSSFQLARANLADGNHKLTVTEWIASGTQSLADRANAEYAQFSKDYILAVGTDSFVPQITAISIEEGGLRIRWNGYHRSDFQSYEILKYDNFRGFVNRTFAVTEADQLHYDDLTFAGGAQRYYVKLTRGGESILSEPQTFSYVYSTEVELEKLTDRDVRLHIKNPPQNIRGIGSFSVLDGSTVVKSDISPANFASVDFRTLASRLYFGETRSYKIQLQSTAELPIEYTTDFHTFSFSRSFGSHIPAFSEALYHAGTNSFIVNVDGSQINRIDAETHDIVHSVMIETGSGNHTLVLSANEQYLLLMRGSKIYQLNPETLSIIHEYPLTHFGLPVAARLASPTFQEFAVTDNGLVLFRVEGGNVIVGDLPISTQRYSAARNGHTHISADGKYLVNGTQLFQYNGSLFVPKITLPYSAISYAQLVNNQPSQLILQTPSAVIVYDCENLSMIRSIAVSSVTAIHSNAYYDHHADQLLVKRDYRAVPFNPFSYVNIATGESKDLQLHFATTFTAEGGQLFSRNGYIIKTF